MKTIRNLVYVLAVCYGMAMLDSIFSWGLSGGFYIFLGGVQLVCIIWLLVLVHKK